jgi:ferric-dicitrate binding protein FerR (iron transport regulator)
MLEPSSEAEVAAFEAWLNDDPDHASTYASFERVAALGERLPRRSLAAIGESPQLRPFRPEFALAAVLFLAVLGAIWVVAQSSEKAEAAIHNPGPSTRAVRLGDGTSVLLETGSELTVGSGREGPVVTLRRGRVRFKVLTGSSKRFSVAAAGTLVEASNSLFDVWFDKDTTRVRVLKGQVEVTAGHRAADEQSIILAEDQGADVRDGQVSPVEAVEYDRRWPAARISFEGAPLANVVATANGIGGPRIEIPDFDVRLLRVSGVLDLRDTHKLARKLAATLNLDIEERGDAILLTR